MHILVVLFPECVFIGISHMHNPYGWRGLKSLNFISIFEKKIVCFFYIMYKRTNVLMFQGTIAKTINESVYIVAFQLLRAGSEDIKSQV